MRLTKTILCFFGLHKWEWIDVGSFDEKQWEVSYCRRCGHWRESRLKDEIIRNHKTLTLLEELRRFPQPLRHKSRNKTVWPPIPITRDISDILKESGNRVIND